jgi:hypothetical protein
MGARRSVDLLRAGVCAGSWCRGAIHAASRSRLILSLTACASRPEREYPIRAAYRSTAVNKSSGMVMFTRMARPGGSARTRMRATSITSGSRTIWSNAEGSGIGSPCSTLRSICACNASSAFNAASCIVVPALMHPGRSGKKPQSRLTLFRRWRENSAACLFLPQRDAGLPLDTSYVPGVCPSRDVLLWWCRDGPGGESGGDFRLI